MAKIWKKSNPKVAWGILVVDQNDIEYAEDLQMKQSYVSTISDKKYGKNCYLDNFVFLPSSVS